jgi:toxin CcdB
MAQFDVYRNPKRGAFPLLLDVQADLLVSLATRVVVPMSKVDRRASKPISRLNPTAEIDGVTYALVFQELAAIPRSAFGERVTSLAARRVELIAALDLLLTGS